MVTIKRMKGKKGKYITIEGRKLKYYNQIPKEKYQEWKKLKTKELRQKQKEYLKQKIGEKRANKLFKRLKRRIKHARNITYYLKKGKTNHYSANIKEIMGNEDKIYSKILTGIAKKKRYKPIIIKNIEKIKENIEHEITINGQDEKGNPKTGTIIARGKTINQMIKELNETGIKEGNKIDYLLINEATHNKDWTAFDCPTKGEESIYITNITIKTTIIMGRK